jgi:Zn finger protein HypA/HybF involved in hydrogenase expression
MGWWEWFLGRLRGDAVNESAGQPFARTAGEPHVFECQACFKIFDSDARAPVCPECDSPDVRLLSG